MTFNAGQLASDRTLEGSHGEVEQVDQRLRATGSTTKGLELGSSRTYFTGVPLGDMAPIEISQKCFECAGPTTFTVSHFNSVSNISECRHFQDLRYTFGINVSFSANSRQISDVLTLNTEADA